MAFLQAVEMPFLNYARKHLGLICYLRFFDDIFIIIDRGANARMFCDAFDRAQRRSIAWNESLPPWSL
jgi:hypothetical protein